MVNQETAPLLSTHRAAALLVLAKRLQRIVPPLGVFRARRRKDALDLLIGESVPGQAESTAFKISGRNHPWRRTRAEFTLSFMPHFSLRV